MGKKAKYFWAIVVPLMMSGFVLADGMKISGVGVVQGKATDKQELVIGTVAFPIKWSEASAGDPGFDPLLLDGKSVKYSGTFDGKKVVLDEAVHHAVIKKLNAHMFFEAEGPLKDDVLIVNELKVELNFLPPVLRQEIEKKGKARAKGVVDPKEDGIRFIILKLEPIE